MKQKTRKGSKHEDRWLGPYTIVELSKTTCRLKNALGKIINTRINLSQLKPYHSPLDHKHIESEDGLTDQSGDDDELSGLTEKTAETNNSDKATAEKEPSQSNEKTAETDKATAEKEPSQSDEKTAETDKATAEKEPSQSDEKTAETETDKATAETELSNSTAPDTKQKKMPPRKCPCSSAFIRDAKK